MCAQKTAGQSSDRPAELLKESSAVLRGLTFNATTNVGFQNTESLLVTLQCHRKGTEQSLGSEVVHDDPLRDRNFDFASGVRIRIESEVQNQFFRCARNSAEVGVTRGDITVIDDQGLLCLSCGSWCCRCIGSCDCCVVCLSVIYWCCVFFRHCVCSLIRVSLAESRLNPLLPGCS
jgi:hypothetical protein